MSTAIVTASYAPDLERCRLLCDSIDRHVSGFERHYILVAAHDVKAFSALATPRRIIVDERDLLPGWLRSVPDPASLFRRRLWLGPGVAPLRGWHVQQLRRIALPGHAPEHTFVYVDSDVVFLRDFDCSDMRRDGRLRLLRRDDALDAMPEGEHRIWSRHAGRALGLPASSAHDYIGTLIGWDGATVAAMRSRLETVSGRHWVRAIAASRQFSECMLYGRYVDEVGAGAGHFAEALELCRVHWTGPALGGEELAAFLAGIGEGQVAIGLQSFTRSDIGGVRRMLGL